MLNAIQPDGLTIDNCPDTRFFNMCFGSNTLGVITPKIRQQTGLDIGTFGARKDLSASEMPSGKRGKTGEEKPAEREMICGLACEPRKNLTGLVARVANRPGETIWYFPRKDFVHMTSRRGETACCPACLWNLRAIGYAAVL
eukprot:CAMPEP_0204383104 /NCGR_PEP_ID=MMETSP0469-20131031/55711_1 /ASSEMBLY_ACC=CAM_ASM_000384 /TAXON_ID=2969 /ORGANISM="Oxyrrhis marina" /LENGTH=141 /DNA_ID=CAMNT_0051375365 /DNA_START=1205 /DNA_END=1631 /DNA_ORIENTATION=-